MHRPLPPQLPQQARDRRSFFAWQRAGARGFNSGTDVGDTQNAADYSRI
jgi:hypothetical protein